MATDIPAPPRPIPSQGHKGGFEGSFTPPANMRPPSYQTAMPTKPKPIEPGSFADLLSQEIKSSGLSKAACARLAKVTDQTVTNWLNGSQPSPAKQRMVLEAIAKAGAVDVAGAPEASQPGPAVALPAPPPPLAPATSQSPVKATPVPGRAIPAKTPAQVRARQDLGQQAVAAPKAVPAVPSVRTGTVGYVPQQVPVRTGTVGWGR